MTAPVDINEFYELVGAYCEDMLSAEQAARLQTSLLEDAEMRRRYILCMHIHAATERSLAALLAAEGQPGEFRGEKELSPHESDKPQRPMRPGSPVLGFLNRISHGTAGMSLSAALTWMVMALCACGVALTFGFIALIEHGGNARADRANSDKAHGSRVADLPNGPSTASGETVSESQFARPAATVAAPEREGPAQAATVARLIHAYDCRWAVGSRSPRAGDDLEPGRKLVLKSGLAEVMFQSGVRAVLQGPSTLEIISKKNAFLRQGRVAVTVIDPDAHGFEIDAPGMKYTDLGTEFGVFVAKDGAQEMHVFRGQVRAERVADGLAAPLVLSAHEAIDVAAIDGPIKRIAADETRFIRAARLSEIVAEQSPQYCRWKKFNEELRKRPDVMAYYDFQPDAIDGSTLRNRAATGTRFDGHIEPGTEWSEGRMPGKSALSFSRPGHGVRVKLFETCGQLTLFAWVKIDGAPIDDYQRIIGSDTWGQRRGEVHWQLSGDGKRGKGFGISGTPGADIYDHFRPSLEEYQNRWVMFAMTYESAGMGRLYFNGEATAARRLAGPKACIGQAIIGAARFRPRLPADPTCVLLGQIDELAIFRTALSEAEIRALFEAERLE